MDNKGQTAAAARPFTGRKLLRQATLILPTTGEQVKRNITLRDPDIYGPLPSSAQPNNERTPLLPNTASTPNTQTPRVQQLKHWLRGSATQTYAFCKTDTAHDIFKCSLAYFIATLATFSVPIASLLGTHQDGNQLVANIVVWFDPARAAGSMEQGILLAFVAFLYGTVIAFASQAVSAFFTYHGFYIVGHVIVLLVFCWGGLGFLAWFKQWAGHPLVNTACSLASLAIVTCITKEGVVQQGDFSYYRIMQVLKMLVMGIIISSLVNLTIWPTSARKTLLDNLKKTTDAFAELLTTISVGFLSGSDEDLNHPAVAAATDHLKTAFGTLPKFLAEAKYEHLLLGTERQHDIEKRLVDCVQRLAQDVGSLRSAGSTQSSLMSEGTDKQDANGSRTSNGPNGSLGRGDHIIAQPNETTVSQPTVNSNNTLEDSSAAPNKTVVSAGGNGEPLRRVMSAQTPASIFDTFIMHLGPPMKSMAWTMKEVLKALPFVTVLDHAHGNLPKLRSSLNDALRLFNKSRNEALAMVYKSKELSLTHSLHVAADFEEVAASCGHFSSSLEDFAETCLQYLDILDELELEVNERPNGRTWRWLMFWKRHRDSLQPTNSSYEPNAVTDSTLFSDVEKRARSFGFPYVIYPYLRIFRREDVKFAIKVGGGATFYAMFAFIPATEPYFVHWHLEWSLVSYMLVCSMNIGASNTTAWSRSYGTLFGAIIAIIVWLLCNENPYALAFCGWLVSVVCFYFIIAKGQGPMGRFILLTYNLSVLYSFALTINDPDTNKDEHTPHIFSIAFHRFVAVILGVIGGLIVTYYIWPVSARLKVKTGLSILWLRMGLIWKSAPLQILVDGNNAVPAYMDISVETRLREYLDILDSLRQNAQTEFKLRGPFPNESYDTLIKSTSRMLDSLHSLNTVIAKDMKATPGELAILKYTSAERGQLALRICHLLSVLAASLNMEYPLSDALPSTTHVRDRLLGKLYEYRQIDSKKIMPKDEDYELLYCYALVTGSITAEILTCGKELEKLFSTLEEKVLKLD